MRMRHSASNDSVRKHQIVHSMAKRHACPVCGKKFLCPAHVVVHQRVHTGEKPYACLICDLRFMQKSTLVRHQRVHTCEMPYACQVCPSKFCKKDSLDRHMKLHESGVFLLNCPQCDKALQMKALRGHLKWHRMERPYLCHLCPFRFPRKVQLEMHLISHTGERPHKCSMCEKVYSQRVCLTRHMRRMHGGDKNTRASSESTIEIKMPSSPRTALPSVSEVPCGIVE
ncbi:hypothetical protein MTO96_004909 [Rhipicephalus appendiculatus]